MEGVFLPFVYLNLQSRPMLFYVLVAISSAASLALLRGWVSAVLRGTGQPERITTGRVTEFPTLAREEPVDGYARVLSSKYTRVLSSKYNTSA